MVREDWAQHGTAMVRSSARIREWLGAGPVLFAVADVKKPTPAGHNADVEAADYIAPERAKGHEVNIAELWRLDQRDRTADLAVVVLHPFKLRDCETLHEVVDSGALGRAFVLIWSPRDSIRTWLNAQGAVDLHAEASMPPPDPLLLR